MRTNIVLDDKLVEEAQAISKIKTKRELVDVALREFVANRKRLNVRDLKGSQGMSEDYDYKQSRRLRQ